MSEEEIYLKLNSLFREVFDDETINISKDTSADDIDDWDSLTHISLIAAIETEFNIRFDMKSILKTKNVGEMVDLIKESVSRTGQDY